MEQVAAFSGLRMMLVSSSGSSGPRNFLSLPTRHGVSSTSWKKS